MADPLPTAKAAAFANGLRKTIAAGGRRWRTWPGGAQQVAAVAACIDAVQQRLASPTDDATLAACVADLRAVLEWSTYQSASLAAARAVVNAQRARALSRRLGLAGDVAALRSLAEAETSLRESVRTRNGFMNAIAARHPQLALPPPLVAPEALVAEAPAPAGRLALIRKLKGIAMRSEPRR